MSRGKILLIVIPAAMAVGVVVALLFLSSLGSNDAPVTPASAAVSSAPAAASSEYWTGATAGSTPLVPESSPIVQSVPEPEAPSSMPPPTTGQAPTDVPTPGGFSEAPTITVDGSTVTVTFKTTTNSTVNSILATTGEAPSVSGFYDYVNRGAQNDAYLEKKATYNVDTEGKTETYTLPDTSKSYWILINTVDNESGQWQPNVTAVPIYTVS